MADKTLNLADFRALIGDDGLFRKVKSEAIEAARREHIERLSRARLRIVFFARILEILRIGYRASIVR